MGEGLAGMGANLFTTGVTALANNDLMEQDRGQREQFAWEMRDQNNQYNTNMANTVYQRRAADLTAAGLNPILAATSNAPMAPQSQPVNISGGTSPSPINNAYSAGAEAALATALAEKARAEKDETIARTPTHQVNIDVMNQSIEESKNRIKLILADVGKSYTTATNIEQQTKNLEASIPQIEATVQQLRALTKQSAAQTELIAKQSGLTTAQIQEVIQKVEANLPAVEKALLQLKAQHSTLDLPRARNEQSVQDSFVGPLSALWKAITPLGGIISIAK